MAASTASYLGLQPQLHCRTSLVRTLLPPSPMPLRHHMRQWCAEASLYQFLRASCLPLYLILHLVMSPPLGSLVSATMGVFTVQIRFFFFLRADWSIYHCTESITWYHQPCFPWKLGVAAIAKSRWIFNYPHPPPFYITSLKKVSCDQGQISVSYLWLHSGITWRTLQILMLGLQPPKFWLIYLCEEFSKCGPWTSNISISQELIRIANSWPPPQTYCMRNSGDWA